MNISISVEENSASENYAQIRDKQMKMPQYTAIQEIRKIIFLWKSSQWGTIGKFFGENCIFDFDLFRYTDVFWSDQHEKVGNFPNWWISKF